LILARVARALVVVVVAALDERLMNVLVAVIVRILRSVSRKSDSMPGHRNTTVVKLVMLTIWASAGLPHNGWKLETPSP
jgi:hypothetical protein